MILSLGTVQLGVPYGVNNTKGALSDGEAEELLHAAMASGFTMLDTSPEYGLAEERIGRFLRKYPEAFKVVSKYNASYSPEVMAAAQRRSVERIGKVDARLLYCIDVDISDLDSDSAEGISVYTVEEAEKVGRFKMIQVPASILDGRMDAEIRFLRGMRKTVLVRSLLLQGALATFDPQGNVGDGAFIPELRPYLEQLAILGTTFHMTLVEMAVRWAWEIEPSVAIVGCETPQQARQIGEFWRRGKLDKGLVAAVKEIRKEIPEIAISPRMWHQSYAFTTPSA